MHTIILITGPVVLKCGTTKYETLCEICSPSLSEEILVNFYFISTTTAFNFIPVAHVTNLRVIRNTVHFVTNMRHSYAAILFQRHVLQPAFPFQPLQHLHRLHLQLVRIKTWTLSDFRRFICKRFLSRIFAKVSFEHIWKPAASFRWLEIWKLERMSSH